ncbi:MAG: hypothetical protein QG648_352 [Patescibacteria group bacterium]|nr:hypothetical protein [Patescibacteria group bacterium]
MKFKNKQLLIYFILLVLATILSIFSVTWKKQLQSPQVSTLEQIKLGKINPKSKEVLLTQEFSPGDQFLITFKNNQTNQKNSDLKLVLTDSSKTQDVILGNLTIKEGDNEICCFEAPTSPGNYQLRFILANQEFQTPLSVKKEIVSYRDFNLHLLGTIPYPDWQPLDNTVITNLLTQVFASYNKELSRGVSVLLVVEDESGAQVSLTRRIVTNYQNVPFGNLVQTIAQEENEALLQAGIIDDYEILKKQYGPHEVTLEIRNISKGVSYIVFNKTILETNLLNQKILIGISLTCPERLVEFYRPIADYIFNNIKLTD